MQGKKFAVLFQTPLGLTFGTAAKRYDFDTVLDAVEFYNALVNDRVATAAVINLYENGIPTTLHVYPNGEQK